MLVQRVRSHVKCEAFAVLFPLKLKIFHGNVVTPRENLNWATASLFTGQLNREVITMMCLKDY